jgi:hypothetical protein
MLVVFSDCNVFFELSTNEIVANAQDTMENAPNTSIRQLSQQINLSVGTTHTMLHKNLIFIPYLSQ